MAAKKIQAPSLLSYRRAVEIGDAAIHGVTVERRGMRFAKSDYSKEKSKKAQAKDGSTEAAAETSNLAYTEVCTVAYKDGEAADKGKVMVEFSLRFLPFSPEPHAVDDKEAGDLLTSFFKEIATPERIGQIGRFYAYNLLNGSWLHRNLELSSDTEISVRYSRAADSESGAKAFSVDPMDFAPFPVFATGEAPALEEGLPSGFVELAEAIADGLRPLSEGERPGERWTDVRVVATLSIPEGRDFFPSQLFTPVKEKVPGTNMEVSRQFFRVPFQGKDRSESLPGITGEKIGHYLRQWDAWHSKEGYTAPIAVEPRGGVLSVGENFRGEADTALDFYGMRDLILGGRGGDLTEGDLLYLLGNLIRGGAFSGESKKKRKKKEEEAKTAETESAPKPKQSALDGLI